MVGAPAKGTYKLILDQDGAVTEDSGKKIEYKAEKGECDKQPYRIVYPLPAYGIAMFEFNG
ncbi:MAG: hypothetical protein IKD68_10995, partial [Solobacterium sp.]|nr:hypothetical protein [Solobacterium sp.]